MTTRNHIGRMAGPSACAAVAAALMMSAGTATATPAAPPAPPPASDDKAWSASASLYAYLVPGDENYAQPTIAYDRERLHGEIRYNYEDLDTGSLWLGYNLSGGESIEWAFTPMLGAVVGETDGVAPGYKASVGWRFLDFYSEGEYLIDADDASDSFFYTWSELAVVPVDWFRAGLVTQRTRVYESDREIERGIFVGLSYASATFTGYVFDADEGDALVVLALAVEF